MCVCVCVCVCVCTSQSERGNTFFVSVFLFLSVSHLSNAKNSTSYIRQNHRECNTSGRCRDLFADHFHTFLLGSLTNLFFFSLTYYPTSSIFFFFLPFLDMSSRTLSRRVTAASPKGWGTSVCKCQPLLNMSATLADKTVALFTRHKDGGLTPYSRGFWTWHNSRDHKARVRLLWPTEVTKQKWHSMHCLKKKQKKQKQCTQPQGSEFHTYSLFSQNTTVSRIKWPLTKTALAQTTCVRSEF